MEELAEYHGPISKSQVEEILNEAGRDGSYLIRDSMSAAGSYCICVLWVTLLLLLCVALSAAIYNSAVDLNYWVVTNVSRV